MTLSGVLWVGGSACAGKSTLAQSVTARLGCTLYSVDEREPKQPGDVGGGRYPSFDRWSAMSLDERWVETTVEDLVADTLALCRDVFRFVVDDLARETRPIVVDGFQPLPELVADAVPDERHAVFLVATPEFRRAAHYLRPHAWATPSRTADPERAQANRLERDDRIGEHIVRTAREHNLRVIVVDGTRSAAEVTEEGHVHLELA